MLHRDSRVLQQGQKRWKNVREPGRVGFSTRQEPDREETWGMGV